jgi:hypothetical protein
MNGTMIPTTASRAKTTATSHHGTRPRTAIPIRVTAMNRRSAEGSRNRPSLETWLNRRAITPSTQSLAAEAISTITAATSWPRRMSTSTTGTMRSRTNEIALGTVQTRSGTTSASSTGSTSPCCASPTPQA